VSRRARAAGCGLATAIALGSAALADSAGSGAIKPSAVTNGNACLAAREVWAASLRSRGPREMAPLRHTVPDGRYGAFPNARQVAQAKAIARRSATRPGGMLAALVGDARWRFTQVGTLTGGVDPRTGRFRVIGVLLDVRLATARVVDAAVLEFRTRPPRTPRWRRWAALGYIPYCVRFASSALVDLMVTVDLRPGARRVVDVLPGLDSPQEGFGILAGQEAPPPEPRHSD
jgi:hypothetical protein